MLKNSTLNCADHFSYLYHQTPVSTKMQACIFCFLSVYLVYTDTEVIFIKKKHILWCIGLALTAAMTAWIAIDNSRLTVTQYRIASANLPAQFDNYRIIQLSDFHNDVFGTNNSRLIKKVAEQHPDLIVITGDFIDSYDTHTDISLTAAAEFVKIAPVYYVPGNHECRLPDAYTALKKGFSEIGVTVLENRCVTVEKDGAAISLVGVMDPSFYSTQAADFVGIMDNLLKISMPQSPAYTIVLAHRPEIFRAYVKSGANLIFTGHVHGGQFRIPGFGGVFAPGQGLAPKFDEGLRSEGSTTMVISRGIGNSLFPFRVNNPPEIVVAVLSSSP